MSRHPTVLPELRGSLGSACAATFDRVQAHSPTDSVEQAAQLLREVGADAAIAVGGGSAIVTARAASIVLAERRAPSELCTTRGEDGRLKSPRLLAPKIPQLVVPSTPTTATPKAGTAVHDLATGERLAMFDPKTRASCIFIDPALLATAPVELFRSASLNAIAMAVSGLEADRESPMSVALLRHSLLLLARWLPRLVAGADVEEARLQLVHAAILCGQGTDLTGGGLVTALGHSLGAKAHVDNGMVNAVLLRHTMQFNAPAIGSRHDHVLSALNEAGTFGATGTDAAGAMGRLLASVQAPASLRAIGVGKEIFDGVASHAMMDWSLGNNPRDVTHGGILQLLEAAW